MTDRFAAQLRQHLLETADERPADGQLASVIDGVAATRQRHPLSARLTWNPDRIGPFPSTALRYGLIAVALALATVGGAILAGGASGPSTVFEGTWITIDPDDGSGMTLVVGPGQAPEVYFEDGYASGGACVNDAVKRFTARGTGEISGDRLVVTYPDGGGCGLAKVEVSGRYHHVAGSDLLVDKDGLAWSRALDDRPTTDAPATKTPDDPATNTQLPATDAPGATSPIETPDSGPTLTPAPPTDVAVEPGPKCFDIPAGETYRNDVEGLSLTVTIPETAAYRWQGNRDWFGVEDYCFAGGPVVVTATAVELVLDSCGHAGGRPPSTALAIEWLTDNDDYATSEPTATTIDGYAATRFEVAVGSTACPEPYELWIGSDVVPGSSSFVIYIVDVDANGVPLGIAIRNRDGAAPAAQVAEAEAIVATMEIDG